MAVIICPSRTTSPLVRVLLLSLFVSAFAPQWTGLGEAALLQGCDFGEELCDEGEVCVPDGLFGQCYSDSESALIRPLILDRPISEFQSELLRTELTRLAQQGLDWPHARAQCVLAYFKLAVAFQLDYDTEFCSVRSPENIWTLVQRVQNVLLAEEEAADQLDQQQELDGDRVEGDGEEGAEQDEGESLLVDRDGGEEEVQVVPILVLDDDDDSTIPDRVPYEMAAVEEAAPVLIAEVDDDKDDGNDEADGVKGEDGAVQNNSNGTTSAATKRSDEGKKGQRMEDEEQQELDQFVHQLLDGRPSGTQEVARALSDRQLSRLVQFIRQLQTILQANAIERAEEQVASEAEEDPYEEQPILPEHVLLLKKDSEEFNNADMGLANTVHKIVKGGIQRVEGNRVYMKVAKDNLTEEELYKLISYLDRKIAQPNNLYFDEFLYEDGQLSFRIARADAVPGAKTKKGGEKPLENASGVAQAVYKRRKDIQTLAGVRVDETGIGSGIDVVPVERSQRDWLVYPIMAVCAATICTLVSVLVVSLVRMHRHRHGGGGPILPQVIDRIEGKAHSLYEDLCRQRAAGEGTSAELPSGVTVVKNGGERSKHSSTSSWPDEAPIAGAISAGEQLDIGTGHVILKFLQSHLENPEEIAREWESVREYVNSAGETKVAEQNAEKNADPSVLPFDESRVQLQGSEAAIVDIESRQGGSYINASKIVDCDPLQPAYIATQAPMENTLSQFWQMVWEQGVALLVNLCDQVETKAGRYAQYWPEEGSKVFGVFEVHLVSEHIWSEHYVVRSLYLKNTSTGETRTITNFHFLTWTAGGLPASNKSLLEFRRKVNKSYRGCASPVLVHCINGAGRTGAYCLMDLVINRIQKGVKELNIAASLEHLRDQRMAMVESEEQFKNVFSCVAEEVSALLKGLQQH